MTKQLKLSLKRLASNALSIIPPKEEIWVISDIQAEGKSVMVGDGINDASPCTTADIGHCFIWDQDRYCFIEVWSYETQPHGCR